MRIALISDIHANLPALNAVLAEIDSLKVDQIICLGDICDLGPQPSETLRRIRELNCVVIQGNHDPFDEKSPEPIQSISDWCRNQLTEDELTFLQKLSAHHEVTLPSGKTLLAVHGSPRGFTDGMIAEQTREEVQALFRNVTADIICGGHTHVQMLRRVDRKFLVNVGSVGCPFSEVFNGTPPVILPWAEYAIVTGSKRGISVDLRHVEFDVAKLIATIRASTMPHAEAWAAQWI